MNWKVQGMSYITIFIGGEIVIIFVLMSCITPPEKNNFCDVRIVLNPLEAISFFLA